MASDIVADRKGMEMPRWDVRFDLTAELSKTELVKLVERAHALAAVIKEIPIPPYLQRELDSVNIMRAVRGTTAIEGAQASTQEVRKIMDSPGERTLPLTRQREEQEIRNAQAVMYYVARLIRSQPDQPLTEALICELHELMTQDIAYENNVPGEYRNHSVTAGDYLPPETGDEIRKLMKDFVAWFRSPPAVNWDPIVRAVVGHFYLISIHPFGDGNGRTSRAVESMLLFQGQVNARGFYSLANYYYQNRTEYVHHLDNARFNTEGDLTPFILFALRGLVSELQNVHGEVLNEVKVISFRDYARETFLRHGFLGTKAGTRGFHLLLNMGRDPMPMAEIYGDPMYKSVTRRTVQRDIKFLHDQNLVTIESGMIAPNFDVMDQFTAVEELTRTATKDLSSAAELDPQLPLFSQSPDVVPE